MMCIGYVRALGELCCARHNTTFEARLDHFRMRFNLELDLITVLILDFEHQGVDSGLLLLRHCVCRAVRSTQTCGTAPQSTRTL